MQIRLLTYLILLLSYSSSAQIDSLNYYYLQSDYSKLIRYAENCNNTYTFQQTKIILSSYKSIGKYKEALVFISKTQVNTNQENNLSFYKADILYKYGRTYQAQIIIEDLLNDDSLNTRYLYLADRIYRSKKKYRLAKDVSAKLLSTDSSNSNLYYKLAYYNAKLKNYDASLTQLYKTLSIDSTYVNALRWLAKIYSAHFEADSALKYIEKAVLFEPNNLTIKEERANVNYRIHYYFRAVKDYLLLDEAGIASLEHKYRIGICYQNMRQPNKSLEMLLEVWQRDSLNYKYAQALAITYKKLKQLDVANQYLDKSLQLLKPDKLILASIYRQKVSVNFMLNNKVGIDQYISKFLEYSNDYNIIFLIALHYDKLNKKALALEYYKRYRKTPGFVESRSYEHTKNRIRRLKEELFAEEK